MSSTISRTDKIIDSFLKLSAKKGAEAVTLHDIARRARVAYGTVRYHFNARGTSVLERALEHVTEIARAFVADYVLSGDRDSTKLAVVRWVEANFEWARQYPDHMSYMVYYYYRCSIDSRERQLNTKLLSIAGNRIQELLYLDIGRGKISRLENIDELALVCHSLVIGGLFRAAGDPDPDAMTKVQHATEAAVLLLIKGAQSKEPGDRPGN